MSEDILKKIDQDVKSHKVLVYMKGTPEEPMCGFSAKTVAILKKLGASFEARDVLADEELRQAIKTYSNWPTIPQIYIHGKFIGGCDILSELYEGGELQKLVE
jgi:monothiol glutaredoxin